jgi:hypothetical protein
MLYFKRVLKTLDGLKTEKVTENVYSVSDKERTTRTACKVCSKRHRLDIRSQFNTRYKKYFMFISQLNIYT